MEVLNQTTMRTDRQLLVITHLTQLLNYVIGFGGLITPLIIWLTSKNSVEGMDEHGKAILNLQLKSIALYCFEYSSHSIIRSRYTYIDRGRHSRFCITNSKCR